MINQLQILNYYEWLIFFGILLLINLIVVKLSNSRVKTQLWIIIGACFSLICSFIIPYLYNYISLIFLPIFLLVLLNGKWNIRLNEYSQEALYLNSEKTVWDEFTIAPESKKWQQQKLEEKE